MKIALRKISLKYYSDLINNIPLNSKFYNCETDDLYINGEKVTLDDISEPINQSQLLLIDIDEGDFDFGSMMRWKENYSVGKYMYRKLSTYLSKYFGDFNEKYFWAYLCHTPIIRRYIKNRYFDSKDDEDDVEVNELPTNKIARFYFANGTPSRTGIMFNWLLTCSTYDYEKSFELCEVAFSFIDSVKAIYERSFHKNKYIVRAFVQGIVNNGRSNGFKDSNYRTLIPTHISNIAAINSLDSYTYYPDLVNKITKEQSYMLDLYTKAKEEKKK